MGGGAWTGEAGLLDMDASPAHPLEWDPWAKGLPVIGGSGTSATTGVWGAPQKCDNTGTHSTHCGFVPPAVWHRLRLPFMAFVRSTSREDNNAWVLPARQRHSTCAYGQGGVRAIGYPRKAPAIACSVEKSVDFYDYRVHCHMGCDSEMHPHLL